MRRFIAGHVLLVKVGESPGTGVIVLCKRVTLWGPDLAFTVAGDIGNISPARAAELPKLENINISGAIKDYKIDFEVAKRLDVILENPQLK